jgi:hypothetical protein
VEDEALARREREKRQAAPPSPSPLGRSSPVVPAAVANGESPAPASAWRLRMAAKENGSAPIATPANRTSSGSSGTYRPPGARGTPSGTTTPPIAPRANVDGPPKASIFGSGARREDASNTRSSSLFASRDASPARAGAATPAIDTDGFQPAATPKWRARRTGPGEAPPR